MPQEWIFQLFLGKLCVICFSLSHALLTSCSCATSLSGMVTTKTPCLHLGLPG